MWGEQHRIDRLCIDPGRREVALNEAGAGLEIIARSGVDDREAPFGMDQEGIDAGAPRRPECVMQDLPRLFEIDIAHDVKRAVEIAVADGGDDDIADPAVIDAGNLLCGLRIHMKRPCCHCGVGGVDQASTDPRNSSMQSAIRSGVCTAI
jgi:hypothetical protein